MILFGAIRRHHNPPITFIVLMAIAFGATVYWFFRYNTYFYGDGARDLLYVAYLRQSRTLPFVGHENIIGVNVPIYYWLLYLVSFLVGTTYEGMQIFFMSWALLGGIFFILFLFELDFPWEKIFLTSIAFLVSLLITRTAISVWPVYLVSTPVILSMFLLIKSVKKNNVLMGVLGFIFLLIGVSIDLSSLLFVLPYFTYFVLSVKMTSRKIVAALMCLMPLEWLLTWLLIINGSVSGGAWRWITQVEAGFPTPTVSGTITHLRGVGEFVSRIVGASSAFPIVDVSHVFFYLSLLVWTGILVSLFWSASARNKWSLGISFSRIFVLFLVGELAIYLFFYHVFYDYYLTSAIFIPFLLFITTWSRSRRRLQAVLGVFLVLYSFFCLFMFHSSDYSGLKECYAVARRIKSVVGVRAIEIEDYNFLGTWESPRYVYCLRTIGYMGSMFLEEGPRVTQGMYTPTSFVPNIKPIPPSETVLICESEFNMCKRAFMETHEGGYALARDPISVPGTSIQLYFFSRIET